MSSYDAISTNRHHQRTYIRNPKDPMFGLKKSDAEGSHNLHRSTSGIKERKIDSDNFEEVSDAPSEDSPPGFAQQTSGGSSSGRWSKLNKTDGFLPTIVSSDSSMESDDDHNDDDSSKESSGPDSDKGYERKSTSLSFPRPTLVKSYSVNKTKSDLSRIPLPQSAATFYHGYSPLVEVVETCRSTAKLNSYLKARREDVIAGIPGKFLHAVLGQDVPDVGCVASTIMYAFYLDQTKDNKQFCTVPVLNTRRAELSSHAELQWLLNSCQINQSALVFLDEIDLSYYDLFGSLKLVLLGDKLPTKQEHLKESVVEIFNCKRADSAYPWTEAVTVGKDGSSCALIAEKFAEFSPEILSGKSFSRLLLAGILLDTGNLTNHECTSKDKYMATLLINGAGRFGCNGLFQILRFKKYDASELKVLDILRKDFRKWSRVGKQGSRALPYVGISTIGISLEQLLTHGKSSAYDIKYFQQSEKLRLLMVVSGYYDEEKNFKREILVSSETAELMKSLQSYLDLQGSQLPLKPLPLSGLRNEMRTFEIDKVTSRKTIERLLEEFGGTSRN